MTKKAEIYRLDIPCHPDTGGLYDRMYLPGAKFRLHASVRQLAEQALVAARPKAVYREAPARVIDRETVEVGGVCLKSRALSKNIAGVKTVFPFIVTVGHELGQIPLPPGEMMMRFYLDTIKTAVLVDAVDYLARYIRDAYCLNGTAHMNPGEVEDWPLTEQWPLFSLFHGAERDIGVELKPSGVMMPVKSRSGIIFPDETGFVTCFLCRQPYCPGRKARYSSEKVREYIGTAR